MYELNHSLAKCFLFVVFIETLFKTVTVEMCYVSLC